MIGFENRLRSYRKLSNLKQLEMAKLIGVSRQYYHQFETGKRFPGKYLDKILGVIQGRVSDKVKVDDIFKPL